MKEIRLCDDGKIEYTCKLCKKNKLGIEVQGFYNPNMENKEEVLEIYKNNLLDISKGKSYHAPFWDLNLGTKIVELQEAMFKIFIKMKNWRKIQYAHFLSTLRKMVKNIQSNIII